MATLTFRDEEPGAGRPGRDLPRSSLRSGSGTAASKARDRSAENATDQEILEAYREPIEKLKAEGGYVTADVINVKPETPGLDAMLNRFSREHWHDEDEVRFIVHGRGLFHIHPPAGPVFASRSSRGDMIRVPRGTHHWFDLCSDRTIRADPPVPGHLRLDAALHRDRRGRAATSRSASDRPTFRRPRCERCRCPPASGPS